MFEIIFNENISGPFEGVCDLKSPTGLYCSLDEGHGPYHVAMGIGNATLESWYDNVRD